MGLVTAKAGEVGRVRRIPGNLDHDGLIRRQDRDDQRRRVIYRWSDDRWVVGFLIHDVSVPHRPGPEGAGATPWPQWIHDGCVSSIAAVSRRGIQTRQCGCTALPLRPQSVDVAVQQEEEWVFGGRVQEAHVTASTDVTVGGIMVRRKF